MGRAHVSPRGCAYKYAVSPNPSRHEQITSAHAHAHHRSFAAAAAGDSIPSATYTVDGRAGLRNHALLVPVRGEGRIGFWAAITRLLTSDRLLPLRPRRLIITMSTDAERAAAEKAEADKKTAEDATAATKAAASAWPTGGYNSFIPLLLFSIIVMLALSVDYLPLA